jgi:hypothetical protein
MIARTRDRAAAPPQIPRCRGEAAAHVLDLGWCREPDVRTISRWRSREIYANALLLGRSQRGGAAFSSRMTFGPEHPGRSPITMHVWMAATPAPMRWKYRQMINALVYRSIAD